MRGRNNRAAGKQKKIGKKERRGKNYDHDEDEGEDFNVQEELEEEQEFLQQPKIMKYESPEELKKRLGREVLNKVEGRKPAQLHDDFFVIEQDREQAKKSDGYDESFAEKLKQDYLRKQNKLYQEKHEKYAVHGFGEPIEYKGHTLCITAFQVTNQHIYSCSKDKSIIKWDRQTKQKQFISLGKDLQHHRSDIICMSMHSNENLIATGGEDCSVKLWDTRSCLLIDTLRGHKNTVNGLKFGFNSNNLCSISSDLTLKQWDFSQRGLIQTFHQHNGQVLDIDCFNGNDFITSGGDHQVIAWKTQKQTKIVFKGHDYSIDRVRTINHQRFVTACQDGSVYLWHTRKNKPVFKLALAHQKGWISAMDNIKQTNVFATAGIDHVVKIWGIDSDPKGEPKGINLLKQLPVKGIVTDLKMKDDYLAVAECDELRLGRWVTDKCRNKIKLFPVKKSEQ